MLACVCRPVSSSLPKPTALAAPQKRPPSMVVTSEPRTTSANRLNNNTHFNQSNSNVDKKVTEHANIINCIVYCIGMPLASSHTATAILHVVILIIVLTFMSI